MPRHNESITQEKKHHTEKHLILARPDREILFLSPAVEGKVHDKRLADDMEVSFPETTRLLKDTGFQGFEPKGVISLQPKKKPRGKELSDDEKADNCLKSQERVLVEHSIGSIKVWRCVREICRSTRYDRRDSLTWYAAGLHNFRLRYPKQPTNDYKTNSE